MTTESIRAGTHSKSWRERVPGFRKLLLPNKYEQIEQRADWYLTSWENDKCDEHARLNIEKCWEEWRVRKVMLAIFEVSVCWVRSQWSCWRRVRELDWKELVRIFASVPSWIQCWYSKRMSNTSHYNGLLETGLKGPLYPMSNQTKLWTDSPDLEIECYSPASLATRQFTQSPTLIPAVTVCLPKTGDC